MAGKAKTVGIFTLGCKVNQYESEAIGELLEARGYRVCPADGPCDVYIINTCTVTAESDRKARQIIRRAISKNPDALVLVTGCLAQTAPESIARIEGVDFIGGNADKCAIVDAVDDLVSSGKKNRAPTLRIAPLEGAPFECMSIKKFDRTRAYIKIEDGCESHCSYCIIPSARGSIRSKAPDDVLREVRELTENGCREVVLTGIETASYGRDLDGYTLADLLEAVDAIPGIGRVRLGSLDPTLMKQDFVDRIARLRSLAPHFHLSMQSGSDNILRLMKRKYNTEMALANIDRLRRAMPRVMLTTDMIVGFPGETEEDFRGTLAFAERAKFLMIHVFPFSGRRGTPAATMSGQIPMDVRRARAAILSELEASIRKTVLENEIRQAPIADVLFEEHKNGYALGHTANFVPVRVKSDTDLRATVRAVRLLGTDGDTVDAEIQK
ncbi:MAG: tRNA (N(6)-L-threonylcarbamoyladenosine(37)-C(2))-methylthiotransferase MtaB [Clostridia bacterium]|nr:tRNA (N(6)-L-threonylcarbamoyladenosine(37)-C(2))-methylthiotransferase MtaB [Clostridia bacterium]